MNSGRCDRLPSMPFNTVAATTKLTQAGATPALATAVVDVARDASVNAAGQVVTRYHLDLALAKLSYRLTRDLTLQLLGILAITIAVMQLLRNS